MNETFTAGQGGQAGTPGMEGQPGEFDREGTLRPNNGEEYRNAEEGNPGRPGTSGMTCRRFEQATADGGTSFPLTFRQSGCIQ